MTYGEIIGEVAKSLGLDKNFVDKVYKSYWRAVREHIEELPLKEDLSEEEFMKLQPNVNIPSIGKLYVTLDIYKGIKKKYNIIKLKKNATY